MSELHASLVRAALGAGAFKAAVIPQDKIILSAEFRAVCESNGCGGYGKCWMCPPDVGEIHELMDRARTYPYGLIYQTVGEIEDSFDIEGMTACAQAHVKTSHAVQRAAAPLLPDNFLHLSCGGCRVCEVCAKRENLPCRHPRLALPSLESYGVNVYETASSTDLKYINGQNTVTYFGMILFGA